MKRVVLLAVTIICCTAFSSKANDDWKKISEDPNYIHNAMKKVTDVMVHDIYSPPVASRIYAYVSVAGYEAATSFNKNYNSFVGQLHGLSALPKPNTAAQYSAGLCAVNALLIVAKTLIISEDTLSSYRDKILLIYKNSGMPSKCV